MTGLGLVLRRRGAQDEAVARWRRAAAKPMVIAGAPRQSARMPDDISYRWRAPVTDAELFDLTTSHGGHPQRGWWDRIRPHSLGWVSAHLPDAALVGFVNLAWDGGAHAFVLDTKVRPDHQRRGIATRLVARATAAAREAGCEWLHVDFEEHLRAFYLDACGFRSTDAGLIALRSA